MSLAGKKSQAAMEFLVLFTVMSGMFSGFMYFAGGQFDNIEEKQIEVDIDSLASDLLRYATFSLDSDYLKVNNFRLPVDVGGRVYDVYLAQDIGETYAVINITDTGQLFFYSLKSRVNGTIDKSSTLEQCIASKGGYASMSPAIIGLAPARVNEGSGWRYFNSSDFDGGALVVPSGAEFSVYVMGNCLHDFKGIIADVAFVPDEISYTEIAESYSHDAITNASGCTPYGNVFFDSSAIAECNANILGGTLNLEIAHKSAEIGPIGSDSLIEVVFDAKAGAGTSTSIVLNLKELKDGLFRLEQPPGDILHIKIS